jgi:heat shock protein HspQ
MKGSRTMKERLAKFSIGEVVRHKVFPFRGVIFDVDPEFANTEEWWNSIPADVRPNKDQPFYHLLAENEANRFAMNRSTRFSIWHRQGSSNPR